MVIKTSELSEAEFIDEWEKGFGWVARPNEKMRRTSHAFLEDGGVYLVDPLDAEGLDQKISEYGEVKGIILLFDRHERDTEELAERYGCTVYVPEWFERSLDADVETISDTIPGTGWEVHQVVDSRTGKETALFDKESRTLILADALGTAKQFRGRGEKLGMNPIYRLNPPGKLLDFEPERIFFGHGEGIQENASEMMEKTITEGRSKILSAYYNAFYNTFRG